MDYTPTKVEAKKWRRKPFYDVNGNIVCPKCNEEYKSRREIPCYKDGGSVSCPKCFLKWYYNEGKCAFGSPLGPQKPREKYRHSAKRLMKVVNKDEVRTAALKKAIEDFVDSPHFGKLKKDELRKDVAEDILNLIDDY